MARVHDLAEIDAAAAALLERSGALLDEVRSSFRGSASPVSVQARSANSKLAPQRVEIARSGRPRFVPVGPYMASTYVSIASTCPDSCAFKASGCFAKAGSTHLTMAGLNRAALGRTALEVTLAEAAAIDALMPRRVAQDGAKGGRDLRLHVGGEVSCTEGARALAGAAVRWRARGGGVVWSFTHRWRTIARVAWGPISVLASCETMIDVLAARARGYAVAVVFPRFPAGMKAFSFAGKRVIPCTAEASSSSPRPTCSSCRLCLDDQRLIERDLVIGFAVHGNDEEDAAQALLVPAASLKRR